MGLEWAVPVLGTALVIAIAVSAGGHAVLNRRDARAAGFWVGFIVLMPVVGALLYWLLGINRIRRSAREIRGQVVRYQETPGSSHEARRSLPPESRALEPLVRAVDGITGRALLPGNSAEILVDGEQAYPSMLDAIAAAKRSVTLCTYIFDNDVVGRRFIAALAAATERGVQVRVLIDALGTRYSFPSAVGELRLAGVNVAVFLPLLNLRRIHFFNLRNHRKILVVDGRIGYTGGMNLRAGHVVSESTPEAAIQDIHARFEGPVVAHLQEMFAEDWDFVTGESLRGEIWFPALEERGAVLARGISDGPDGDIDNLRFTLLGALSSAQSSVRIVTPYFLPGESLVAALNVAAMRGVEVDILLPQRNNLPFVHWASMALLWQVLSHGCRVWLTPPPFDHSKLVLVDGGWSLLGSTNWDPRALRLNFEFNVECYDRPLAAELQQLVDGKLEGARRLTIEDVDGRSLPVKVRDGVARLFTPYL